jgi:hypothetical protein
MDRVRAFSPRRLTISAKTLRILTPYPVYLKENKKCPMTGMAKGLIKD